ncbi:MAG TPA: aspartyl-phosphate phosphatase Spo0E family protein [Firmicutes bacterium]|jgi:hypothetical protein|nr:aspartyl-phosphate phosphatase Spo0E family protein [Bacillota bacterium]
MQKKNDTQKQKLDMDIQKLKILLQQKVKKYNSLSHPEVLLISKELDRKLNMFMSDYMGNYNN